MSYRKSINCEQCGEPLTEQDVKFCSVCEYRIKNGNEYELTEDGVLREVRKKDE